MPWRLSSRRWIDCGQESDESLHRTSPLTVRAFNFHQQVRLTLTPSTEHSLKQYTNSAEAHIKQISQPWVESLTPTNRAIYIYIDRKPLKMHESHCNSERSCGVPKLFRGFIAGSALAAPFQYASTGSTTRQSVVITFQGCSHRQGRTCSSTNLA